MWASRNSAAASAALADAAPVFAALGDPTRLRLVARLSQEGPLSISRLSEDAGVSRQAVTKHLRVLADAGLARGLRQGREQHWQLEAAQLAEARRSLDHIARRWDEALGRLKRMVESLESLAGDDPEPHGD